MTNTTTNYTNQQLVEAISKEYDFYCLEDFNPEEDLSSEEMRTYLMGLTYEQLVNETSTGEMFTLEEFMTTWGEVN